MLCDPSGSTRVSQFEKSDTENYIDNYLNVPVAFAGFIMTTDHLLDMARIQPRLCEDGETIHDGDIQYPCVAPPEISCGDFGQDDGKVIGTYRVYKDLVDISTDNVIWDKLGQTSIFCFSDNPVVYPGMLEPMMDTTFPPIGLDANISTDMALDGAMLALVQLTKWRINADSRLNALSSAIRHIGSLRNLLTAINTTSICDQFKIKLRSGSPLQYEDTEEPPRYDVTGGKVLINGVELSVAGVDDYRAPMYAFLCIDVSDADDETGQYMTVTAQILRTHGTKLTQHHDYVLGIGGVRRVKGKQQNGYPTYYLYEIVQERCEISLDLVRTDKAGILFRETSGKSPYKVLDTIDECD